MTVKYNKKSHSLNIIDQNNDYDEEVYHYEVPAEEASDYRQILKWIRHLCGKVWFTAEMANDLIIVACDANGIESPY